MSDTSGYPGAPPGWYPDPAGGPGQRWWDGYAWNEATIQPSVPPPPPGGGIPPAVGSPPANPFIAATPPPWVTASAHLSAHTTAGMVAAESKMGGLARWAVAVPGAYFLVTLINDRINEARNLSLGHQIRVVWDDAQRGITPPPLNDTSTVNGFIAIAGLVMVVAIVIFCIWQHRAATAARALGLPSTHSPGWGVGSWFVPIVNFWMPYQAIRDCLPAGDPARPLILRWWLIFAATWLLCVVTNVISFFSSGVALVFALPSGLLCLALVATAPRLVSLIGASHQAALQRSGPATSV